MRIRLSSGKEVDCRLDVNGGVLAEGAECGELLSASADEIEKLRAAGYHNLVSTLGADEPRTAEELETRLDELGRQKRDITDQLPRASGPVKDNLLATLGEVEKTEAVIVELLQGDDDWTAKKAKELHDAVGGAG